MNGFNIDYKLEGLLAEIAQEAKEIGEDYLDSIRIKCVNLYKQAIAQSVYVGYDHGDYYPTYQLLTAVTSDVEDGVIYIYYDYEIMYYWSVISGTNKYNGTSVTEGVPLWVNEGHGGVYNYKARHFAELAKKMIENELGVEVEIMYPPNYK
jgi:hypothetical protein